MKAVRTMICGALLCGALQACAIVEVRTAEKPPKLSFWPLGVKVDRADSDAVQVSGLALGVGGGCGAGAFGVTRFSCTHADPNSCGVAIVVPNDAADEDFLGQISDQSRAWCLHHKGRNP